MKNSVNYFLSFNDLQARHDKLLNLCRQPDSSAESTAALWKDISDFVQRAQASGVIFDARRERRAVQSILDYWTNELYRTQQKTMTAELADFDPTLPLELPEVLCPYRGLDAFHSKDHAFFYGRQRLVDFLINRLKEGQRLLAVVGPSGCGKSSLVLAGLVPLLQTGALPGSKDWHYYERMAPGFEPLVNLARLLQPPGVAPAASIQQQVANFRQNPAYLRQLVHEQGDRPIVLIVDQFEEIFTLCNDDDGRQAFVENLMSLLQKSDIRHVVIFTMRTDFESHITRLPSFPPLFEQARIQVTPLTAGELREAIEKPAEKVGLKFEDGVVDALLADILGEPAALPLLQFTLLKLWERRERNRVTWQAYERLGGGRLALAHSADEFYAALLPEEQVTVKRILLQMVQPGEGVEVTNKRLLRAALYQSGEASDRIDRVLDKLIQARLVRLTKGETPVDDQVEVAHEALVRNWPRFIDWLDEARAKLRQRLRLRIAAEEWDRLEKDTSALWSGIQLEEAIHYSDRDALENEFVQASLNLQMAQQKHELAQVTAHAQALAGKNRALKVRGAVALLLAFVAIGLFIRAQINYGIAVNNRNVAEANLKLAAQNEATAKVYSTQLAVALRQSTAREWAEIASSARTIDPEVRQLIALQALSLTSGAGISVPLEVESVLQQLAQNPDQRIFAGHTAAILDLAASPDGKLLATASADKTVKIWEVASRKVMHTIRAHRGAVTGVAFNPDGTLLATASDDATVNVWRVDSLDARQAAYTLYPGGKVSRVVFSPDGKQLAITVEDVTLRPRAYLVKIWQVAAFAAQQAAYTLTGHTGAIIDFAFSSDGRYWATASMDGFAKIWDGVSASAIYTFTHRLWPWPAPILAVAFSPDGTMLATGSGDGRPRVWDIASGVEKYMLRGHKDADAITSLVFDQTGTLLASASEDGTVRVWDMKDGANRYTLSSHVGIVKRVIFSQDNQFLFTGGTDKTARSWYVKPIQPIQLLSVYGASVSHGVFSLDGQRLAIAGKNRPIQIQDTNSGQELFSLVNYTSTVSALALDTAGARLALGNVDGQVTVWDTRLRQEPLARRRYTSTISALAFSPDGSQIAIGNDAGQVGVWNVASWQELSVPSPYTLTITALSFNQSGTRLATGDLGGHVMIWHVDSSQMLYTFPSHVQPIRAVAFSPDERLFATAGDDQTVKVWDMNSGQLLFDFSGHTKPIYAIAFSPNGKRLSTGSADMTIMIWDLSTGQEVFTLTGHTGAVQQVVFSQEGKRLVSLGSDGMIRVYTLDFRELMNQVQQRVGRTLTATECKQYLRLEQCPTY